MSHQAPRHRVGVIGAGRVGATLGAAFAAAGHPVAAVSARTDESRGRAGTMLPGVPVLTAPEAVARAADLVLVAVPDDALAGVVTGLAAAGVFRPGQLLIHTSGAKGLAVLEPAAALGAIPLALHPAMTFTGTPADLPRLVGCPFAVTAPPAHRPLAEALVTGLGGRPFWVPEADRVRYHAALSHGANHLVTLVAQASDVLRGAGVADPAAVLRPLLSAALDNVLAGGEALLTGPIARGDAGTVAAHLAALDACEPAIATTYRALAAATVDRAETQGRLPGDQADAVREALRP